MLEIGCHLSSSKGYEAMAKEAEKIHANTLLFSFLPETQEGQKPRKLSRRM